MHWIRARDQAGRVLALPNQTPNLIEQYGLTRAAVEREVWLIESNSVRLAGAAAINRVLKELRGGWAWLSVAYRFAPFRWIEDCVYRWVADHRHWFARWGVTPECEQPGVDCR